MKFFLNVRQFMSYVHWNNSHPINLYIYYTLLIFLSALSKENFLYSCLFLLNLSKVFTYIIESVKTNDKVYKRIFSAFFCIYLGNLYWIYAPLTFDIKQYFWFIPFAVIAMPIYLSLYSFVPAFCILKLYTKKIVQNEFALSIIFSAICIVCEIISAHVFTGFTWHTMGYCWVGNIVPLQIISLISIYGLSFCTYLIAILISFYIYTNKTKFLYIGTAIFSFILIFGITRLNIRKAEKDGKSITIKIVQGNVWQSDKEDKNLYIDNLEKYIKTSQKVRNYVDLEIWPEVTFPWIYSEKENIYIRDMLSPVLKNCNNFIFGAIRKDENNNYYNSAIIISDNVVSFYDKQHLLPFGEYIPAKEYIKFSSIANQIGSFEKGKSKNIFKINGFNVLLQICYEAIFPPANYKNADFVLNITNDGWFKNSQEAKHHHFITRAMAIEYGLPYIRVNNYGFSGCFDRYGRALAKINIDCATAVKFNIFCP